MGLIDDKTVLNCLNKTLLQNDIPESAFGLSGFGEDRLCIEKCNDCWQVYYGFHGKKLELSTHPDVKSAARELLGRCCGTTVMRRKVVADFESLFEQAHSRDSKAALVSPFSAGNNARLVVINVSPPANVIPVRVMSAEKPKKRRLSKVAYRAKVKSDLDQSGATVYRCKSKSKKSKSGISGTAGKAGLKVRKSRKPYGK